MILRSTVVLITDITVNEKARRRCDYMDLKQLLDWVSL